MNQVGMDHPKTLSLDQVEKDVNYALVISTNAGLWRYMIGDTVKFTSLNPFRTKITGRTINFINAVGEEIIIDNAIKALSVACNKCNAIITDFTAAPVYFSSDKNAAHEWLIEFEKAPENIEFLLKLSTMHLNHSTQIMKQKDITI